MRRRYNNSMSGMGMSQSRGSSGMISKIVTLGAVIALFYAIFSYGPPMYKEYKKTGAVTIPIIDYKIDIKDISENGIDFPDLGLGSSSSNGGSSATGPKDALAMLNNLQVKGKAPKTGYSRDQFGSAWTDKAEGVLFSGNGCDTRNDILRRDLKNVKLGSDNCTVMSGTLSPDPYTNKDIDFVRGPKSSVVQIDHLVALGNAWVTGAQQLSAAKRIALANDPVNLLAVDGPSNGGKSDRDASAWLPPNKSVRCSYVSAQVNVKAKYGLWVTQAEKDAIAGILAKC